MEVASDVTSGAAIGKISLNVSRPINVGDPETNLSWNMRPAHIVMFGERLQPAELMETPSSVSPKMMIAAGILLNY